MFKFGRFLAVGAALASLTLEARALERVQLRLVGLESEADTAALGESLQSASVLNTLEKSPDTVPRDVVAAARADYTRLVETLYAQGYYSAVVRIGIDGRRSGADRPVPGTGDD